MLCPDFCTICCTMLCPDFCTICGTTYIPTLMVIYLSPDSAILEETRVVFRTLGTQHFRLKTVFCFTIGTFSRPIPFAPSYDSYCLFRIVLYIAMFTVWRHFYFPDLTELIDTDSVSNYLVYIRRLMFVNIILYYLVFLVNTSDVSQSFFSLLDKK